MRWYEILCLGSMFIFVIPTMLFRNDWYPIPEYLMSTLALVLLLLIFFDASTRQLVDKEKQLAQGRITIMLSQIQPHFLYNTLSTMRALCRRDPQKAETAMVEFTEFLRQNMDSLSADKTISFEQELAHTRHYLNLELIRFQNKLNVVYDIRTVMFRLPTLTLQPIVENAVRYGVTKRAEGGTVKITTMELEKAFCIIVSDNGVGYDVNAPHEDGRSHIGIRNVQMRLSAMCGGNLVIESEVGIGTTATIMIPKEEKKC